MFKKKAQLKPYAPLRSSDRRKIAQSIIDDFGLTPPSTAENRDAFVTALRNSLLPENTNSAKFTTNLGPDLEQVGGLIYVGTHPEESQRPLWVKSEGTLFPTVYTLWKNPTLLPLLHTHPPVIEKLYTGADLMTPGLIGPPFPAGATKGKLVAIASSASPTVALAVGVAEIDVSKLSKVAGEKGKAVRILHWFGDELGGSGGHPPEKIEGVLVEEIPEQEEAGGVSLEGLSLGEDGKAAAADEKAGVSADKSTEQQQPADRELTTKEIDEAFSNAAIFGLYHHLSNNTHTSIEMPITPSAFMSTLVLPFLPPSAYFNADTGTMSAVHPSLQIKKTSWKNIAKFLKQLDKDLFLKTKTRQGNEVVVLDIDWDDDRIKSFVPYKLPITATNGPSASTGNSQPAATGPLKVLELYKPTTKVYSILDAVKANSKEIYSPQDLKSIFNSYLDAETEAHPTNKRLVKINPLIANSILNPSIPEDKTSLSTGTAKRDVLTQNFLKACSPYYLVLRPGETYPGGTDSKPSAGSPPKVTITVEQKRGKVMTRIVGVEAFRIDPAALGEELRTICASSASVSQLAGSSPKHPVMEIMVQGPQDTAVKTTLEGRGVPGKCIVCVDDRKKKAK